MGCSDGPDEWIVDVLDCPKHPDGHALVSMSDTKGLKVLVCGGRNYEDEGFLNYTLDTIHFITGIDCVVHGDAGKFYDMPDSYIGDEVGFWVGADKLAAAWARKQNVREVFYKPDWNKYGRKGGPIRNQQMLDTEKPDLVVAFPGGRGTADMVKRAKAGGFKVCEVGES